MKDETWERYLSSLLDIIKDQKAEIVRLRDANNALLVFERDRPDWYADFLRQPTSWDGEQATPTRPLRPYP